MEKRPKNLKQAFMLESVDTDADGQIDADELRDLADDLEGEPLTGEDLRDALISAISDMHKDIYGMRANATALRQLSTEELEQEHDRIDQQHKDWWYEERHREDQDMWIADEERETEELSEPEEGEDMPKFMGMGRGRIREMTRDMLRQIIDEEFDSLTEGEVVDMFSGDQKKKQGEERIARALAARAEEMLDVDDDSPNYVEVMVDPKLFLTPYPDTAGDGRLVRSLAQSVYEDYVSGKAGDQAESLEHILGRISIDYFDEPIEDTLSALGDDRFDGTQAQMMRTKEKASQQDPGDIGQMELDFDKYLQGIESGDVVELEQDDD